jgi:ubiquinone/menaquinone biosynthesis C-methylase UbiE
MVTLNAEPKPMKDYERAVGRHYDEVAFEYEVRRLHERQPVEFQVTLKALARWLPPPGSVCAEIGVGSGAYSLWLASRGHRLYLADVSARLLQSTLDRLRADGHGELVLGAHHQSATDLNALPDSCADAVLALGPLYHLLEAADRERAVGELARILRPNGILFAAGINRLAFLRDGFCDLPETGAVLRERYLKFLEDGNVDPSIARPLGYAHLSTTAEFENLFAASFEKTTLWGLESFTGVRQERLAELNEENAKAWLDLVEATLEMPDTVGFSDHFLYVGRRRSDVG